MPCHREYIVTAQGGYDPAHTLFYEFAHVEHASGCYVLDHQSDGTLQEDHEENVPMGFVTAARKCSKSSPGARNAQHAWFPHEPTHAYGLTRENGVGA